MLADILKMNITPFLLWISSILVYSVDSSSNEPWNCRYGGKLLIEDGKYKCECLNPDKQQGPLCQTSRVNLQTSTDNIELQTASTAMILKPMMDENQFHIGFSFVCADYNSEGRIITFQDQFTDTDSLTIHVEMTVHGIDVTLKLNEETLKIPSLQKSLTDNKWHNFDLIITMKDDKSLEVVKIIDQCRDANSPCQQSGHMNSPKKLTEIHVGGKITIGKTTEAIGITKLCIEEVILQNSLVDFWNATEIAASRRGCTDCERFCEQNVCGNHAVCRNAWSNSAIHTCRCEDFSVPAGDYPLVSRPTKCINKTVEYQTMFEPLRWAYDFAPVKMRIGFRSRLKSLDLLAIGSWGLHVVVKNDTLEYTVNEETSLIENLDLLDGNWHSLELLITPTSPSNKYSLLRINADHLFERFSRTKLFPHPPFLKSEVRIAYKSEKTCLSDLWVEYQSNKEYSKQGYPLLLEKVNENLNEGCDAGKGCVDAVCPNNLICVPLWRAYECICPEGLVKSMQGDRGSVECVVPSCEPNPCLHDGSCSSENATTPPVCSCIPGWRGERCEYVDYSVSLGHVPWWILALIIFIIILILLMIGCIVSWHKRHVKRAHEEKMATSTDMSKVHESMQGFDNRAAGEKDIDSIEMFQVNPYLQEKKILSPNSTHQSSPPPMNLPWINPEGRFDKYLHLDEPLTYSFEGFQRDSSKHSFDFEQK